MKILFIRPKPSGETIGLQHLMIVEPLELEVMAAVAGPAHHCEIADMILEKKPPEYFILKEQPDILCVTGYITNVPEMIRCCRSAKNINPEIVTITGGVHCEVCPADLDDESIDYRVVRNATVVFPQLLDYLQNGGAFPAGVLRYNESVKSSELAPFDFFFPQPDRRLTSKYRDHYFYIFHDKVALIKTSFGCPFACNFCFCREITRGAYHERPLEEVMEELKSIREKNIYIVDDDFLTSRTRVKRFIEANLDGNLQKNYLLYGRADFIAANPDLMAAFRTAGLRTVIVGIESFNDRELQNYNKNITAKTNEDALNILKLNRIDCYATVIVPPTWGKEDFTGCLKKIKKLGIHYVNLQPYTPLPGTGLKTAGDDLIIPYHDYAKWDLAHVTIRPEKMSVAEFYRNILRMYRSILFQPVVLLNYLRHYNNSMLIKMMKGSYLVWRQYRSKIKESQSHA